MSVLSGLSLASSLHMVISPATSPELANPEDRNELFIALQSDVQALAGISSLLLVLCNAMCTNCSVFLGILSNCQ